MIVVRATLTDDTVNFPMLPNYLKRGPIPVLLVVPEIAAFMECDQLDAPAWSWGSEEVDDVYLGD